MNDSFLNNNPRGHVASSDYSQTLDRIQAELDHLQRAFNELRPASERPGPARCVATHIAYAYAFLNGTRLTIKREIGL